MLSHRFRFSCGSLSGRFLLFFLFRQLEQLFLMLKPHVIDLHIGKRTILQCLLDCESGVIGMYVHLHHVIIRNHHDGIADGLQISLEIHLLLDIKGLVQHDDKFGAVAEFDLHACLRFQAALRRYFRSGRLRRFGKVIGVCGNLSRKGIKRAAKHLHKSLSAGIHHACLLQYRKHLRRLAEHILRVIDDFL